MSKPESLMIEIKAGRVKEVLDPCCGSKMFWFDKSNENVLFLDIRSETHTLCDGRKMIVSPDDIKDFRKLPYADNAFRLVVFDPPHLIRAGKNSWMAKKYGVLNKDTWKEDLSDGFKECWRVLDGGGTLIFKWNETQVKIKELLSLFPYSPLFGQTTTVNLKTHWIVFFKPTS